MPTEGKQPRRVAVIHDWLVSHRGGEQILEAILELFPEAEIFTLFHKKGKVSAAIEKHPIHVSFLNGIPESHRFYRHLLPLFPLAIEKFNLSSFDLVISSSHCVAKGILPPPNALHVCYCHTPMRYAWDRYPDYFSKSVLEPLIYLCIHYLRIWDTTSSHRVDSFAANSEWVRDRIRSFYRRDSQVVYPFVDLNKFKTASTDQRDYYLTLSAFSPYKRVDLAIEACEKLGKKLVVVGSGQDEAKLKALAGPNTRFVGRISDAELVETCIGARALLFPGEEDFGIAPLEMMACGRPVIAYGKGGVTESVVDGETGLFFFEQSVDGLADAILRFEKTVPEINAVNCRRRAESFSREKFLREFSETVESAWEKHQKKAFDLSTTPLPKTSLSPGKSDPA